MNERRAGELSPLQKRLLTHLSLTKRAAKLVLGFDPVKDAVLKGKLERVYLAQDLSPKSEKEVQWFCKELEIPVQKLPLLMDELWYQVGKRSGILGVTDPGLEQKLFKLVQLVEQPAEDEGEHIGRPKRSVADG